MFCQNCGTKLSQGVKFCAKCGEKVVLSDVAQKTSGISPGNDTVAQQSTAAASAEPITHQIQDASTNVPKKSKRKKLPLILGAAALIIIIIVVVITAAGILGRNSDNEQNTSVNRSETYINGAEGISFQYPSGWKMADPTEYYSTPSDVQASVVLLVNRAGQKLNSIIGVLKFSSNQKDIDHLYISDEEFAQTFSDNVSIIETSLVTIDGIEARKIAYVEQGELYYLSYMYGIGNTLYRINFICHNDRKSFFERFFNAIMDSYTITTKPGQMSSGFSESLEYYSELSGLYEGSNGQSSLSISIFSSLEKGETSIGNVRMYIDDEYYYLGEITAEPEKDVYLIETDTGEDIMLDVYSYYGTIVIDLYVDELYIDKYIMVEHYES